MIFSKDGSALVARRMGETLRIEPWGKDALRVRATMAGVVEGQDWALTEPVAPTDAQIEIGEEPHWVGDGTTDTRPIASIANGRIRAVVNFAGVISFIRDDRLIRSRPFDRHAA